VSSVEIVLSSAAIGAVIASLINGVFNLIIKNRELRLQDIGLVTKMAELKHQQLIAAQDWTIRTTGTTRPVDFWDPLQTAIGYLDGLQEYRKTGKWAKADKSHGNSGSSGSS
jgi:hypothetical protein